MGLIGEVQSQLAGLVQDRVPVLEGEGGDLEGALEPVLHPGPRILVLGHPHLPVLVAQTPFDPGLAVPGATLIRGRVAVLVVLVLEGERLGRSATTLLAMAPRVQTQEQQVTVSGPFLLGQGDLDWSLYELLLVDLVAD